MVVSYLFIFPVLIAVYGIFKLLRFGRREKHLPPGPPTYPIVGNAHLVVDKDLYKRANDEHFRTALKNENIANMDADSGWRAQRRIAARFLAPANLDSELAKISEAEITTLLHDLLISPEDFSKHIDRASASFSAIALFGQRATTYDDFWATMNRTLSPGAYLPSDQFPIFKLIPKQWNPAHARAEENFRFNTKTWSEAQQRVEARRNQGDKRTSLIDEMLDDISRLDESFKGTKLSNFLGALMQGAADTGALAMRTNIMFIATHKWVQNKAQNELDALCGVDRLPSWTDFKDLPYINCIMKEGLRIRPVVPTGIPHACTQDNWYEGMLIPKDATVMIPHWALHHSQYDDPDTYNPDRYLNHPGLASEYAASQDYQNRDHYSYGAGRRICVGIQLAERTQFRMLAAILWAFHLEHAVDEKTGEEVPIDIEAFESKLIAGPKPFKVRFMPRSPKHIEVIKRELGNIRELLEKWG